MMQEAMGWLNNGLAVLIVIAGGIGIYRVAAWIGTHLALPLRDAGINHLNKTGEMLSETCKAQQQTAKTMETICVQLGNLQDDVQSVKDSFPCCRKSS